MSKAINRIVKALYDKCRLTNIIHNIPQAKWSYVVCLFDNKICTFLYNIYVPFRRLFLGKTTTDVPKKYLVRFFMLCIISSYQFLCILFVVYICRNIQPMYSQQLITHSVSKRILRLTFYAIFYLNFCNEKLF